MFTPEFISEERGEYLLVSSHSLETAEAMRLSIAYNRARIAFGQQHLPARFRTCRLIYDIRGQAVADATVAEVERGLRDVALVEFKR